MVSGFKPECPSGFNRNLQPMDRKAAAARSKERLLAHLSQHFPGYTFDLVLEAPFEVEEQFVAVPLFVEGKAIHGGLENALPMHVRTEIEEACADFSFTQVH